MDGAIAASTAKTTRRPALDNFRVTRELPRAADSKGTNTGDYKSGVTRAPQAR